MTASSGAPAACWRQRGRPDRRAAAQGERPDDGALRVVAEHHDLELPELVRSKPQRRELQKAPKHDVTERPEQEPASPRRREGSARLYGPEPAQPLRNRINAPHTPLARACRRQSRRWRSETVSLAGTQASSCVSCSGPISRSARSTRSCNERARRSSSPTRSCVAQAQRGHERMFARTPGGRRSCVKESEALRSRRCAARPLLPPFWGA